MQLQLAMARFVSALLCVLALGTAALAQQSVSTGQDGTLDSCQVRPCTLAVAGVWARLQPALRSLRLACTLLQHCRTCRALLQPP